MGNLRNSDELRIMKFKKTGYGTLVTIQRTPVLKYADTSEQNRVVGPLWKSHVMSFILTKLSNGGTIIGEWIETNGETEAVWGYTSQVSRSLEPPKKEETILMQHPTAFRMVIGAFGMNLMDDGYFGAHIFSLHFFDEPEPDEYLRIACLLSNRRETGFYIKLQTIKEG
jgi:hypothetical protein